MVRVRTEAVKTVLHSRSDKAAQFCVVQMGIKSFTATLRGVRGYIWSGKQAVIKLESLLDSAFFSYIFHCNSNLYYPKTRLI